MLFDPKWEQQTKPDVFSLAGMIAWLEQQPPETAYNWKDIHGCLACRYLQANGFISPAGEVGDRFQDTCGGSDGYGKIALGSLGDEEWTYGAALKRARRFAAERGI